MDSSDDLSQPAALVSYALSPVAHALAASEVLLRLESDATRGLSSQEAAARLARYGYNELAAAPPVPMWRKLVAQFKDLVIWILIVAAVISGAMGEWIDTLAILAIVLLNGVLGFFQEERAERRLAALAQALVAAGQGAPRRHAAVRCPRASWCPATASSWRPATTSRPTPG